MASLHDPHIKYILDCLEEIDTKGYDKTHLILHSEAIDGLEDMLDG